jgi:hypothetical protein
MSGVYGSVWTGRDLMKWPIVVAVMWVVFPWIPVVWEPVVLESVVWKFEEANLLVTEGFLVNWQVYL